MSPKNTIIVDSIHGDIRPNDVEKRVIDTASFQRLRRIKQLSLGHVTYPNATHSRFAHSLGVLSIMQKVMAVAATPLNISPDSAEDLRLAALLHDLGHYPYSHLMEGVDRVLLTEELVDRSDAEVIDASHVPYPDHEDLGRAIVTNQKDILGIIGAERANRVADLFARTAAADPQLSKLLHSSLDMDRLDYLVRDSRAAGVPFGQIDINYLLNSLRVSPEGLVGVDIKALPAAEQFLIARYFMHRVVYWHKTTVAVEEACRQLIRRIRNRAIKEGGECEYKIPRNGDEVMAIAKSSQVTSFDDTYIDRLLLQALEDEDRIVSALADSIVNRRPPPLVDEFLVLDARENVIQKGKAFLNFYAHNLKGLAEKFGVPLEMFLYFESSRFAIEKAGPFVRREEARNLEPEEQDELIKVFESTDGEPRSLVEIEHGIVGKLGGPVFQIFRVYILRQSDIDSDELQRLRKHVREARMRSGVY